MYIYYRDTYKHSRLLSSRLTYEVVVVKDLHGFGLRPRMRLSRDA